jgi:hypothetical protein
MITTDISFHRDVETSIRDTYATLLLLDFLRGLRIKNAVEGL